VPPHARGARERPTGGASWSCCRGELDLVQRIEQRVDKREDCRKQVDARKLGPIERIEFVRKTLEGPVAAAVAALSEGFSGSWKRLRLKGSHHHIGIFGGAHADTCPPNAIGQSSKP
jgi:hypothetical protein